MVSVDIKHHVYLHMHAGQKHFTAEHVTLTNHNAENHFFYCSCDDSSEPVPSTSSEPIVNRPPTQDGKQTRQESASASKRPRSNQVLVKNVDCH